MCTHRLSFQTRQRHRHNMPELTLPTAVFDKHLLEHNFGADARYWRCAFVEALSLTEHRKVLLTVPL